MIWVLSLAAAFLLGAIVYRIGLADGLSVAKTGRVAKLSLKREQPRADPIAEGIKNILSYGAQDK